MAEPTTPKLVTGRGLIRAAWRDLRANLWRYLAIVAIVTVPVDILMLNSSLAADGGFTAYTTMAAVFMNTGLIAVAMAAVATGTRPTVKAAYYDGTRNIVALLLVNLVLLLVLVPSLFGFLIYSFGSASAEGIAVTAGEQALLGFVWLVFSIPTIWLLVRYVFAVYGVVGDNLRPVAALRASRKLSLGRYWRVFSRLLVMLIIVLAAGILVSVPLFLISLAWPNASVLTLVFQLIASLFGLPFAQLYLARLYSELKATA